MKRILELKNEEHMCSKHNRYFPLRILISETQKEMIVQTPKEIPNGVPFRVIETNYNPELKRASWKLNR